MKSIKEQQRVLRELSRWRDAEALRRGVAVYLVLPNTTINAVAQSLPESENELLLIKGIKEAKLREFGTEILRIVNNTPSQEGEPTQTAREQHESFPDTEAIPISRYLNSLNQALKTTGTVRVIGEVGQIKEQGSAVYFTLKDKDDASLLSVFMWKNSYGISGVTLEEGMEIVAGGISEIYKPTGRLSFRAETIELVGEGALKQAYEKLRKTLEQEGLFDEARKKQLPIYPVRVGLITSRTGAVIHDFLNNLGKHGYIIRYCDSRVEGIAAVKDIINAILCMKKEEVDVLVLIRGGGSFESLQAFNNEKVVRALASFPAPVICAIGHDQDVPLAQLVSDYGPSTPTAATVLLNKSWNDATATILYTERTMLSRYSEQIWRQKDRLRISAEAITGYFININTQFDRIVSRFQAHFSGLSANLAKTIQETAQLKEMMFQSYLSWLVSFGQTLSHTTAMLRQNDPSRQLRLGYSILRTRGGVVRSIKQLPPDLTFEAILSDGTLIAKVIEHKQHHD